MMSETDELIHATAVIVGDRGVLVMGASGSGKSSVANALIVRASARGMFASLVSDDQCLIQAVSNRLICNAPETLRGGLEIRGAGLYAVDHEPVAAIHLVVQLVESAQAIRYDDDSHIQLKGVSVAQLTLPEGEIESVCRAVEARLFEQVWKKCSN
jgi:serine kinase of HPr protein (carbohydrate metabolism regulator)